MGAEAEHNEKYEDYEYEYMNGGNEERGTDDRKWLSSTETCIP